MNIEINIVTRIIALSIFAYFFIKLILTLLYSFSGTRTKRANIDIDTMIKRKEAMLRASSGLNKKENIKADESRYAHSEERAYCELLKKTNSTSQPELFADLQIAIDIFDCGKWGQGPSFKRIAERMKKITLLNIDESEVSSSLSKIIKEKIILSYNSPDLMPAKGIEDLILTNIFLNRLVNLDNDLISLLARQALTSEKTMITAIDVPHLNSLRLEDLLYQNARTEIKTISKYIKEFQDRAFVIDVVTPLNRPLKGDKNAHMRLFNLKDGFTLETLKKRFKMLALDRHPDRLGHLHLSDEELKIATENFAILSDSFDYLKQDLS